jgi:PST family polysaccharide transporter
MTFTFTRIRALFHRISNNRITHNVIALYGIQIATYVVPLSVVPYLARVLGPYNWGLVALAQALGFYVSMVVDFGFQLSGARKVARLQESREDIEGTIAGIMGAKILLAAGCIGTMLVVQLYIPSFRQNSLILWAGVLSGVGQGFSMLWLYQGLERMKRSSTVDILAKIAGAVGVFVFVHKAADGWKVLGLQCLFTCAGAFVLLWMAYRDFSFRFPSGRNISEALKESASMFLFRSAVSLYTTANALILGAVATPLAVGFYSGAERIARGVINLTSPVSQSIFPRVSNLVLKDSRKAITLVRLSLMIMTVFGLVVGTALFVGAPFIVRILLGKGYESAVPVLRILSLLVPSVALGNVLGVQWMLPLGMDRQFNKIIITAGVINVGLALWWASRWQHVGMAWAVSVAEMIVTILFFVVLIRSGLNPLSDREELVLRMKPRVNGENWVEI